MERKDIDERLKWDTTSIYEKDEDFYEDIENIKSLAEELKGFEGKITKDLDTFKSFLKLDEKFSRKMEKAYVFSSLKSDEDTRVTKYQEMKQIATNTYVATDEALSFIRPELLATDYELTKEYLKDPEIKNLDHYFDDIYRSKE